MVSSVTLLLTINTFIDDSPRYQSGCLSQILQHFVQRKLPGLARHVSTIADNLLRYWTNNSFQYRNKRLLKIIKFFRCHTGLDPVPFSSFATFCLEKVAPIPIGTWHERVIKYRTLNKFIPTLLSSFEERPSSFIPSQTYNQSPY